MDTRYPNDPTPYDNSGPEDEAPDHEEDNMNPDHPKPTDPSQDTPETDAVYCGGISVTQSQIDRLANTCSDMERQRNAALQQVRDLRAALEMCASRLELNSGMMRNLIGDIKAGRSLHPGRIKIGLSMHAEATDQAAESARSALSQMEDAI